MSEQQNPSSFQNPAVPAGRRRSRRVWRVARWAIASAVGVALAAAIPSAWFSQSMAAPATGPANGATQPSTRTSDDIKADLTADGEKLGKMVSSFEDLIDPAKRAEMAPKVLPLMKHMISLMTEEENLHAMEAPQIERQKSQFLVFMSVLGDPEALATLKKQAASSDAAVARSAKSSLLLVAWWHDDKDVAAQKKVLDDARALAKVMPEDEELAGKLAAMYEKGAASSEIRADVAKIITDELKGEGAQQIAQQIAEQGKMLALENKPMTITGMTVDGKQFSTADWKGKVILIDFWATWCGPCRAELPNVVKAYNTYHDKGFEILGVSNDYAADDLTKFLAQNKDMPWPQLFDAKAAGAHDWNPVTKGFGIEGIPTMFLIDRNGVCRSVEARGNLDELIPKLLAEPAK